MDGARDDEEERQPVVRERPERQDPREARHRGRFGMYVPPVLEEIGLAEVEHNARNNRMRART